MMTRDQVVEVLQTIAVYDNRKLDTLTIAAWTEAAERARWTHQGAIDAVHHHFARSSEWCMPAHITERLRADHKHPPTMAEVRDLPTGVTPLPSATPWAMARVVWASYEVNGAIERECPNCKASPGDACITVTDKPQKSPCISRLSGRDAANRRRSA